MTTQLVDPAIPEYQSAYDAFRSQLSTLCLSQFPCGLGSWRDTVRIPGSKKTGRAMIVDKDPVESKFSVTLKDYPVETYKIDQLEEFVKSNLSPWRLDYTWSHEARQLRETAVKSPWLVDEKYVHEAFKSLKIVDQNVSEIDSSLLKLRNLEELTLSANYLKYVQSENLPDSLKVLELCGNQIDDLRTLCHSPPPLLHLGLGHNPLYCTDDYITGEIWPHLVSLDLSHNHLSDLFELISRLSTLPKLRNLVLLGNPLFLLPGYRGYVVDSLRLLQILDDRRITADEKHNFKGLAKRKDCLLEEVNIRLAVDFIKGLPVPEEIKNPGDQPEFPVVTRKYYVEFMFPRGPPEPVDGTASVMTTRTAECPTSQDGDGEPITDGTISQMTSRTQPVSSEDMRVLAPIRSAQLPYAEEVETNWAQIFARDELMYVRDFMKDGLEIQVMEEKILSFPADQMSHTPDGKKDKKKDKKDDKGKGKSAEKKDDKKNKKKKDLDIEMHHMPPQYTTFAKFHIPLVDFLDGDNSFHTVFSKGEPEKDGQTDTTESDVLKKGKKKEKPPSAVKKDKKDHPKSPKSGKDKAGKGKGDKTSEEDDDGPPPPLEVSVRVKLMRFQTTAEAIKAAGQNS